MSLTGETNEACAAVFTSGLLDLSEHALAWSDTSLTYESEQTHVLIETHHVSIHNFVEFRQIIVSKKRRKSKGLKEKNISEVKISVCPSFKVGALT